MLGKRSEQKGLWEADRLYLDYVGKDTFYGLLASLRGQLFSDDDFAEIYCPDNGRDSVLPTYIGTLCSPRSRAIAVCCQWQTRRHCAATQGRHSIQNVGAHPGTRSRTGGPSLLKAGMAALRKRIMPGVQADPDVFLYATWISVWGRWFIWLVGVFLIVYRPGFWYPEHMEYLAIPILLFAANGLVHHRLLTHRPVTWRWLLFLGAMDVALTTLGVFIGGGFRSFIFVAYYPAVAIFAVVFPSYWHTLAWSTMAAAAYVVVCLVASPGLDLGAGNEKVLVARLAVMYAIVLGINLITRFERARWHAAVARERRRLQERIELSQTIHDTTAQTVYMIGLGIHRSRELAGESNRELAGTGYYGITLT